MVPPIRAFFKTPTYRWPAAAPEGDRVAFVRQDDRGHELAVLGLDRDGVTRSITDALPPDFAFPALWDRDGERLFIHRDDVGGHDTNICAVSRDGTVETLIDRAGKCVLHDVSPGNEWLLFDRATHYDQEMRIFLHAYHLPIGETTELTEYWDQGGGFAPNGERLASQVDGDLFLTAPDGGGARHVSVRPDEDVAFRDWHPDGRRVLIEAEPPCIYDLDADRVTWSAEGTPLDSVTAFGPDGTAVLGHQEERITVWPMRYDPATETASPVPVPDGVGEFPSWTPRDPVLNDGSLLVTHSTPITPERLLRYNPATGAVDVLLEREYPASVADGFVDAERITYESTDGLEIDALLYDPGVRPAPGVVMVHGGPHHHDRKEFAPTVQLLASRGYAVLQPNYRGSTGRGESFQERIADDYGGGDADDVRAAGEWLRCRDWVDADRVAVYGRSYGAYVVCVQVTRFPGFWAAAVAYNGYPDGWEDGYVPVEHADEAVDPLLLLVGEHDPGLEANRVFREALTEAGRTIGTDFEYTELEGEGHHSRDTDHQVRRWRRVLNFLDEHVGAPRR